ncbi:hypothetical protein I4U23_023411 [Adineta vaga]|nr:hypothetical protein I4U23_023411 [Adineta vaga]
MTVSNGLIILGTIIATIVLLLTQLAQAQYHQHRHLHQQAVQVQHHRPLHLLRLHQIKLESQKFLTKKLSEYHIYLFVLATSTTSVTTTTSTTTTTQGPTLASLSRSDISVDTWTLCTYTYTATVSGSVTLTFTLNIGNKHDWYLDDVSVKDSTLVEMLINCDFESSYGSSSGISAAFVHSESRAYFDKCNSQTSISQSFSVTGGHVYSVTFWIYLDQTGPGHSTPSLIVTIN